MGLIKIAPFDYHRNKDIVIPSDLKYRAALVGDRFGELRKYAVTGDFEDRYIAPRFNEFRVWQRLRINPSDGDFHG